jgi:hypothetical protein
MHHPDAIGILFGISAIIAFPIIIAYFLLSGNPYAKERRDG